MKRFKTYQLIIVLSILAIIVSSLIISRQIYLDTELDIRFFSAIHFAGYLFFLLMPVEILFGYYLAQDFNIPVLLITALITAILAEVIDYAIGYLVSRQVIHKLIGKKRYNKSHKYIDKYGNVAVFVFNLFPLSSSVLSLAAGMVRYKFRYFLLYTFLGLSIKYIVIIGYFLVF